jgi:hypothetical protein
VIVVSPGNVALEVALATERAGKLANIEFKKPEILTSETYKRDADGGAYDLIIYDQCVPPTMPRANTMFIGRLPPGAAWRGGSKPAVGEQPGDDEKKENDAEPKEATAKELPPDEPPVTVNAPQIIDWDRAHPILASVELGNVNIWDSIVLQPPPGATVLIDSTAGPVAAVAPRDAYQDIVTGFEIVGQEADGSRTANTNWPRFLSFPTFCLNTLEFLAGGTEDSQLASTRPGRPVEIRPSGNVAELTIVNPDQKRHTLRRTAQDLFQYQDTSELGVYDVRRGDQVIERFAVNLFDRQESDVRVRPTQGDEESTIRPADIRIGNVDVAATVGQTPSRTEVWKLVLGGALFVLILEWYIYNRRVYL